MTGLSVVLAVVLAAGSGGLFRYLLAGWFNNDFPSGTLIANIAASGFLALVVGWGEVPTLIVGLGFAGSLSTWSTLANEVAQLLASKRTFLACTYLGVTLIAGVLAATIGLSLGQGL